MGRDGDSGVLDAAGVPEFDVALPPPPHHPRQRRAWAVARGIIDALGVPHHRAEGRHTHDLGLALGVPPGLPAS